MAEALRLFRRNPKLGRYVFAPFLWGVALFVGIALIGYFVLVPPITSVMTTIGLGSAADDAGLVLFLLVWLVCSGVMFMAVAGFLSSLLWDGLSAEIESMIGGGSVPYRLSKREIIGDSLRRMGFTVLWGLAGLGCSFAFPLVGPILIAGYLGLIDYTASGFARRGVLLKQQKRAIWKLKGWPSFWLTAGVVAIIPILNVLAMPVMVAAGTVMVLRSRVDLQAAYSKRR